MATRPTMPKVDPTIATLFRTLLPKDPRITVRPMFGHIAAFVNGQMFAGTFGTQVFARLNEPSRVELLGVPGATVFAPMKDPPMKEYVQLPPALLNQRSVAQAWIARALEWTSTLPKKAKRQPKAKGVTAASGRPPRRR